MSDNITASHTVPNLPGAHPHPGRWGNARGRRSAHVRRLTRETGPVAGGRVVEWVVDNDAGEPLEPGYYLIRATIDDRSGSTMLMITE